MDHADVLADHPLFVDFTQNELIELISAGDVRSYRPGETILREGQPGTFLGIVLSGAAEARRTKPDGQTTVLGAINPGGYFGEISLVSGEETTADVVAASACEVLQIPHSTMSAVLSTHPQAMTQMARTITRRLTEQTEVEVPIEEAELEQPPEEVSAHLLVLRCLGDSLQYHYYDTANEMHNVSGHVDNIDSGDAVHVSRGLRWEESEGADGGLQAAAEAIVQKLMTCDTTELESLSDLSAVGHCIPHGGELYSDPIDGEENLQEILNSASLREHPQNRCALEGLRVLAKVLPEVSHAAVFETGFFAEMPPKAFLYPVPYSWYEQHGLRKYGRQGLVHRQAALLSCAHLQKPLEDLDLITCCLGPETSMALIREGRAVDTTGGFTSLEGLPGATTCGTIDPGLPAEAAQALDASPEAINRSLYHDSGLKGLSDLDGDIATIMEAAGDGRDAARRALEVYCYRIRRCLGACYAVAGEVDAVVFAGPWATSQPELRARICTGLDHLGISMDAQLNAEPPRDARGVADISHPQAAVPTLVASTDEMRMIASDAARAVGLSGTAPAILANRRPIPIGISVHHLHLCREHVEALFGEGHELTFRAPLSQPGQFACEETVDLVTEKGRVPGVRVLGPERPQTQVEVSRTECFTLGLKAPIRMSGDLDGTPGIRLEGPEGAVDLAEGVICAARHLHVSPTEALMLGIRDRDEISVRVEGERSLTFSEVIVRVNPNYRLDMHVDTDEANAARLEQNAIGYIENIDVRS